MQVDIVFKGLQSKDETKEFVNHKTEKLKKYFQGKIHARWNLSHAKENCVAHLHVTGNHIDMFSESEHENLFSAVEQAVDKVEIQLKKQKEKVKEHR